MRTFGHDISWQRSRQLTVEDFARFDLILAMDQSNLRQARKLAPDAQSATRVQLLLDGEAEVPDPYYGGPRGFENVYLLIDQAAERWVKSWEQGESMPYS
jgi:protein-tyrosine phosphatase